MDTESFRSMSTIDRIHYLWNHGDLISEKVYYDCNISLFLLDKFYVEVFFNREQNVFISADPQENLQILYQYVKNLDLRSVVEF